MGVTSISWTERSVNPIRARMNGHVGHHCEKLSAGCANCYSSRLQSRFKMPEFRADQRQGVEVFFDDARLREVLTRRKPTKWFWCDMTDLFGDWVEEAWIDKVFAVCALTPQHTHQILTKRPERMRAYLTTIRDDDRDVQRWCNAAVELTGSPCAAHVEDAGWPLPNVWLGVSGEDQDTVKKRTHVLLETPAAVRFLSLEPMLSEVDLHAGELLCKTWRRGLTVGRYLDLVIVGGESGPKARPCRIEWLLQVIEQCRETETACWLKQLGSYPIWAGAALTPIAPARGKCADPAEWPEPMRVQQFPEVRS